MALETATYISDLVDTNPAGTDPKAQGDDHIKMIKRVSKATFPNVTGEVTPTHTQINSAINPAVVNISNASSTITWNVTNAPRAYLTADGNKTMLLAGLVVGTFYLRVYQGASPWVFTWDSAYRMPGRSGGFPPALGVSGDYTDIVLIYDGVSASVNYNFF